MFLLSFKQLDFGSEVCRNCSSEALVRICLTESENEIICQQKGSL